MKRTVTLLGMLLVIGCGDDEDKDTGTKDSGVVNDGDGDSGDGDTGDGDGGDGDSGDAAVSCVDHSEDTVSSQGFSCNVGPTCVHYIGSAWTEADVKASCERTAIPAMATACMNEGFCERTTDTVCKISREAGKDMYGFGMPAPLCMGIGGTVIPKPAAGWPADYSTLAAPGDGGV